MTELIYPQMPEHSLVVLIGPSGAGKSTIARTWPASQVLSLDAHARLLRERADEIDQLADHAPQPIGQRLRANANRLRGTADTHDATAQPAEALT
ncbi:AAA family ATPase [Streptomyces rochei]|uniref:AAA family ATPase n=1 Tax=Streptomyces rochei TaxID=1928 RepID=UPI00378A2DB0